VRPADLEPTSLRASGTRRPDELSPGPANPAWCTYGTCPNCAFLIRRNGTVHTVQTWFDAAQMESAMRSLLSGAGSAP